ncbi:hypothetical protein SANA_24840 [Gottschalkiaceae bacterium SANA]|nr:hypothetical protein SANA_24840 [Gottschalkiaceae bacterium SANA]
MNYNKTTWGERQVEFPNRFVMVENEDGTITLTPAFGNVIQGGTPLSVGNMQKMDDELEFLDKKVSISKSATILASGWVQNGSLWEYTIADPIIDVETVADVVATPTEKEKAAGSWTHTETLAGSMKIYSTQDQTQDIQVTIYFSKVVST